jgi:hypothetical protein
MEFMDSYAFRQWAFQFLTVLFLVGGLLSLATGVSLIAGSGGTLRFLDFMNRWISTRRAFKPLEARRDTRQWVQEHRRWLAAAFVAGAVFALVGLNTQFDAHAVSFVFGLDRHPSSFDAWLVESARWALIIGNLAAIVIGIMLGFFPGALAALEARGGRWYSDRALAKGADTMHLSLDVWVAAWPRVAGWVITVAALVLVGDLGMMLFGMR